MGAARSPQWAIVSLIETKAWAKDVVEKAGGALARTYLFDATRLVHCCELTASYELFPIETLPWKGDETGVLRELLQASESDDVVYIHAKTLDVLTEDHFHRFASEPLQIDEGESVEEAWARARESMEDHAKGNQAIAFPRGFAPQSETARAD